MSRYIDTKWLEDNAKEYSLGYYEEDEWATPLNVLDSAPSIDIVRCKECKYAHMTYGGECKYCDKWSPGDSLYLDGDFFCSYGEREGE